MPAAGLDERERRRRQLKAAMVAPEREDAEALRVALEAAQSYGLAQADLDPALRLLKDLERQHMPRTFTDVPRRETERLLAATSREEQATILRQCMGIASKDTFQLEVLAEFDYHNFVFCQRRDFGPEKMSTFLSIMRAVHTRAVVQERLAAHEARFYFEALLEQHSRQLPPFSVGIFSERDVAAAKEFAERTFFRLYDMYAFMYAQRNDLCVQASYEHIEPPVPSIAVFHTRHKIDPQSVPQLRPPPPPAPSGSAAATGASVAGSLAASAESRRLNGQRSKGALGAAGPESLGGTGAPERASGTASETQADVLAAIDDILGPLHTRMMQPPE
jgi:hypothetical protein